MKRVMALLICALALTGCVYVQDSHSSRKGSDVTKEQAALVQAGKTDREWILKNFGTPDRIHGDKDGFEVFEYVSEKTQRVERKFILLFSVENEKVVSQRTTRVTLRNGVVESIDVIGT
jgi:outer membrane protein assembly factor BamE (lipoprotein component of BamABCDE complex)